MNRMEEFASLMEELEAEVPALEGTLERAKKRAARKKLIIRPLTSFAACFAVFVLLVNFCTPVAYACSLVPGLRELAEAVTFSRSLTNAVENEYVQPMDLTQTDHGITATVEYLIVDQKQVNVFYRLDSQEYDGLDASPRIFISDGKSAGYNLTNSSFGADNGELRSFCIDFTEDDVPESLILRLHVSHTGADAMIPVAPENVDDYLFNDVFEEPEYIVSFDFLLEFDPQFTATGRIYPINQTLDLEGQKITISDMEVYPTHLRLNVQGHEENTAWLEMLYFYIETNTGEVFDMASTGFIATSKGSEPDTKSYRADSPYFYIAKDLKIVITGAQWLRKDMEKVYVNLATGETGPLPEGVALHSAARQADGWLVEFRAQFREGNYQHSIMSHDYFDAEGNQYTFNVLSSVAGDPDENGEVTYFIEQFPLRDYPYDEVWLSPAYSHVWTAENVIIVDVQ